MRPVRVKKAVRFGWLVGQAEWREVCEKEKQTNIARWGRVVVEMEVERALRLCWARSGNRPVTGKLVCKYCQKSGEAVDFQW